MSEAAKKAWATRRKQGWKPKKKQQVVGFFKDEDGKTKPITKPKAELKRKKVVKKPKKFKGVSPEKKPEYVTEKRSKKFEVSVATLKQYALEIKSELEKCPVPFTVEEMYVIGSQVRRDKHPRKDSDVDLLVRVKLKNKKTLWNVEKWSIKVERGFRKKHGRATQIFLTTNESEMKKFFPEVKDPSKSLKIALKPRKQGKIRFEPSNMCSSTL